MEQNELHLLQELLTEKDPLGPSRHERILKKTTRDNGHYVRNDWLLYKTDLFDDLIRSENCLIVGRRGSGKTAIIAGLKNSSGDSDDYYFKLRRPRINSQDIYVFINSWEHLDTLVDRVGTAIVASPNWDSDWGAVLVERVARLWQRELWQEILKQVYDDCLEDSDKMRHFPKIHSYIRGDDFSAYDEFSVKQLQLKINECKQELFAYLESYDARCKILVDSLEQYPISNHKFSRVLGGFLKLLNDFPDEHPRIQMKCCIPEEALPIFIENASNILKDIAESADYVRWSPIELLKIVAERYREFLRIYDSDSKEFIARINSLNFERREGIIDFFGEVMAPSVKNLFGSEENAIAYVIRHTQLLPREFILIFNSAITKAKKRTRSWSYIDEVSLKEAVAEQEQNISDQILNPYKSLYPGIIDACNINLPSLPPIFSMSEIDAVVSRFPRSLKESVPDIRGLLFSMGIIGYCSEFDNQDLDEKRYLYSRFHYNAKQEISFVDGQKYCMHPVFSGRWGCAKRKVGMPFVYPAEVVENL